MNVAALALSARRTWRGFRAMWTRWVAIVVLLTLGLGLVVGLLTSATTTLAGIELGATQGRLADGLVETEVPLTPAQIADVEALGARLFPTTYVDLPGRSAAADTTVRVFRSDQAVNKPTLDAGVLPRTADEAMVEALHAEAHALRVGDVVSVNGTALRISGLGSLPDYTLVSPQLGKTGEPARFALMVVTPEAFQRLADAHPRAVVSAYGYVLEGATHEQLRAQLQRIPLDPQRAANPYVGKAVAAASEAGLPLTYPAVSLFVPADDNPRITSAVSDARMTMTVTLVATLLVLLLVAYVLAEFSRDRIVRESLVIGTLSAHGSSRGELVRYYLALPLAVTVLGSVLGTILGAQLGPYLGIITDYYSYPALPIVPSPGLIALAIGTPTLGVALVNVAVLSRALNRPTQELLRPQVTPGPALPVRLDFLPFVTMFRARLALRTLGSYLLIAAGLFLCVLLLVFGLGMRSSMDAYLARAATDLTFSDFYTLRFPDLDRVPAGAHEVVAVPAEVVEAGQASQPLTVLGLPEGGNPYFPVDVRGLGEQELLVTKAVAEKYSLGPGDLVTLRADDLNWSFEVAGVTDYATGAFGFTTMAHAQRLLNPAIPVAVAAMSEADGGTAVPYYSALLSDAALDLDPNRVASHSTRAEILGGVVTFNALLSRIVALVTWSSMLIMVVVLYVLIRMVLARQRYSISLLKALGYSDRELGRLYLDNYLWLVVATLAVSIPASVAIMGQVWRLMTADLPIGIPFLITPTDAAAIVGLALGAYLAVRLITSRDARSVPVTEVLKFRE